MKATYNKKLKIKDQKSKLRKFCSLFTAHCSLPTGFTLLEIIIALAIIGGVLVVILHTVNYHAQVSHEDTILTTLTLLAEEKMVEIEKNPINKKDTFTDKNISYETIIKDIKDVGVTKLTVIVRGYGKEVVLSELIVKR